VVRARRRRAARSADLSPLERSRAGRPGMPGGAGRRGHPRDRQLRQARGHRPGGRGVAGPAARQPPPGARPSCPSTHAEPKRAADGRSHGLPAGAGALHDRGLKRRRALSSALVRTASSEKRRRRTPDLDRAAGLCARRAEVARAARAGRQRGRLGRGPALLQHPSSASRSMSMPATHSRCTARWSKPGRVWVSCTSAPAP
jgi:hypothetical protein